MQSLVYGVLVGSLYGLAAAGLALVFGVMRVLNVAHGELLMLGGYLAFWLFARGGIDPFVALPLVAAALFVGGYVLHRLLFQRVAALAETPRMNTSLLASFAVSLLLHTAATQLWTGDERSLTPAYAGVSLVLGDVHIPLIRLGGLAVAIVASWGLARFLAATRLGRALRATATDWQAAALQGIDVRRMYALAFPLGAALAGLAGVLVAAGYSVSPQIGLTWTLKALIVIVLAGLGSVGGTLAAGVLLGVAESIGAMIAGGWAREVIALLLFLTVLVVRPHGLFGRGARLQ